MDKNGSSALLMMFSGLFIGMGICGIYYEINVMPNLNARLDSKEIHIDFLKAYNKKLYQEKSELKKKLDEKENNIS